MKKKFTKNDDLFMFFQEYWSFVQETYEPEETAEYYNELFAKANNILKKYPSQFCRELVVAHMNDTERRKRKEND